MRDVLPTVESGIDYITAVFSHSEYQEHRVAVIAHTIQRELERQGEVTKPARVLGYDCWVTGPLTWGSRADGYLVRVSSSQADTYCNRYPILLLFVTRLDLQVTLYHADAAKVALNTAIKDADKANKARKEAQRFALEWYSDIVGPQTLYIGSRSTSHFGRIYDKYQQSHDEYYKGCLRYEVECKGDIAKRVGERMYETPYASAYQAGPFVAEWFGMRGVTVPGGYVKSYWPLPRIEPAKTDTVRRLKWLYDQVRPTVAALLKECSTEVVYYSLGLMSDTELDEEFTSSLKEDDNA
jgi:hypothetical protein